MKKLIFATFALALMLPLRAAQLIEKFGHYTSAQKTSDLSIKEKDGEISYIFTLYDAGKRCTTEGTFDASTHWAIFLDGENRIWVYRGGDKVLSSEISMPVANTPGIPFTAINGWFHAHDAAERKAIPLELLQFIENQPTQTTRSVK